ncbi:hypothetical protein F2Q65_10465 [Thiohalocapsa marina]|uniref:Uncharacterized protein n=1 Tax=Thiohalocapsa marina TaxID=424902 RepID=A0A5M8FKE1_9GAMM|nr:hypothetical protein [Thiohalocapsa marina]KAA6184954.1 hypothetical protein F2Q65_10465 [Thiohalocapsa marina]
MSTRCRAAYAQARLQAAYAALPEESDWERLRGARTLSGWLEEARDGALKQWVKAFSAQSDHHDIEQGLRRQFDEIVEQTAHLMPVPWQPAIRWCAWLPRLGLLEHLRSGGSAPDWAQRDARLTAWLSGQQTDAQELLGEQGAERHWLDAWRRRWPRRWPWSGAGGARRDRAALDRLAARIGAHLAAFRQLAPARAWDSRRALREQLRRSFHQHLLQPVSAFIFLALVALDLERLRRALLDRALFAAAGAAPGSEPEPDWELEQEPDWEPDRISTAGRAA